ncbi:hypothetical protein THAOC_20900 [Thalassiosira oceanica]|uniref:Sulfotransferase domain-containing protein n=1 Tax=Thalassiosira oceanica TaxID=159749 RepID=K0SDA7_THAOC|nr:hypothetical protein THAOC_20900 [Thalassiosira oceanica]|eukprot:EJK58936.1 hypothetical protein THAOC_20900 [Thalassiosira oceanica]
MNTFRLVGLLAVAASLPYLMSSVGLRRISSLVFEDVKPRNSLSISKNASVTTVGGVHRSWGSSVIDQTYQATPPNDPRIYLIHIGKCGGETIMETLGRGAIGEELECRMRERSNGAVDDECIRKRPAQFTESALSRRLIGRYHLGSPRFSRKEIEWLLDDTDTFLYLIRDPLDRVRSAFEYHKNKIQMSRTKHKKFYVECFPGRFNDVVEAMRGAGSDEKCKGYADRALGGGGPGAGHHFSYNYQKYRNFSLGSHPSHSVMVIRTEHLWEDMIRLDKRLGGDGRFAQQGTKKTHGSESYASNNSTFIAPENAAYLCCAMYGEIEVYQELILKAVNLSDEEKREDLVKVMRHCQMDVADGDVDLAAPFSWQEFGKGAHCAQDPTVTESSPGNLLEQEGNLEVGGATINLGSNSTGKESTINIADVGDYSEEVDSDSHLGGVGSFPENPRIYLIHIGKCGGVTTMETLGRGARSKELMCRMEKRSTGVADDDCRQIKRGRNSTLSRRIIGRYHVGSPSVSGKEIKWLLNNTDTFLYLIRDPLDRARSAFEFHKHTRQEEPGHYKSQGNQRFYVDCFPDRFNDMVETMRGSSPDKSCKGLALDALSNSSISSRGSAGNHFYHNYQKYREFSLGSHPSHSVMVIRTEHLWDDMIRLDKRLGGDGHFAQQGTKKTHGSESYASNNSAFIAPENAAYLCCVMYGEIEVYQELILKAVNLSDEEKREDLVKVMRHCQMDVADGDVDLAAPFSWQEFGEGADCRRRLA